MGEMWGKKEAREGAGRGEREREKERERWGEREKVKTTFGLATSHNATSNASALPSCLKGLSLLFIWSGRNKTVVDHGCDLNRPGAVMVT